MSAVTAAGILLRIRKTTATLEPLAWGTCCLMSGVDAWFIGTEFDEASGAAPTRDAPPSADAPGPTPAPIGPVGDHTGSR
jgi:hypothetical protein